MQKERKKERILAVLFVFILMIAGCGEKSSSSESTFVMNESNPISDSSPSSQDKSDLSPTIKGRYIETTMALPDCPGPFVKLELTQRNGLPYLYASTTTDQITFTGYLMNKDGTWTKDTPKWLASLSLPDGGGNHRSIFESKNGNQYLYYDIAGTTGFRGKLLCSTDGTAYKELKPEGWENNDSPDKVIALDDGTIVALFENGDVYLYDKDSLKIQYRIVGTKYSANILSYSNNALILGKMDDEQKIVSIDLYDMSKNYEKTSYAIQSTLTGNPWLFVNENNDLTLCNSDGIHVLETGTSIWQTIIDGSLTNLSLSTLYSMGFIADSDGDYYILYRSVNGSSDYSFMKYTYDKTVDSIPSTELTIYSLKDYPLLRQAANSFQHKYPNVKISFSIAMTDEEYAAADKTIKDDYVRALNTELLAGGGSDLLVLDGLPTASFVEKGILSDMSNVIKPMIDNKELLGNIMNNYIQDGKIYYIPLRFYMQMIGGKVDNIEKLSTLESFADYVDNHKNSSLIGTMTLEDFINIYSPFLTYKIIDSEGNISKEQLISVLNDLKAIGDNGGIVDEYSMDELNYNMSPSHYAFFYLFHDVDICVNPLTDFREVTNQLGSISQLNCKFSPFENAFTPTIEIGINNASKQQELCREFIATALSEDVQKNDYFGNGFAVNKEGLKACSLTDYSNSGGSFVDKDGSVVYMEHATKTEIKAFVDMCSTVTRRTVTDDQIISAFKEEIGEFLKGNRSVDETATSIINKTQIYMSE